MKPVFSRILFITILIAIQSVAATAQQRAQADILTVGVAGGNKITVRKSLYYQNN